MKGKRKQVACHFKMEKDTAQKLDLRIKRSGFASRTDFFTAVAEAALGQASEALEQSVRDWIDAQTPRQNPSIEEQPHQTTQNRGDETQNQKPKTRTTEQKRKHPSQISFSHAREDGCLFLLVV